MTWTPYTACEAVEFEPDAFSEEERLSAWQYLVDSGLVTQLQGWYGRTAAALIDAGLVRPANVEA